MKVLTYSRWIMSIGVGLMVIIALAACGTSSTATANLPVATPVASQPATNAAQAEGLAREDGQGAVTVKVTPLNLDKTSATLDFNVVMDTHSVDLSMDLTQLATLQADTGAEVQASAWPKGSGHHYEGTLTFPARTADGKSLWDGATKLTLTIRNVDAPERVFEWDISK